MTPAEAVAVAWMDPIDLWRACRKDEAGDYLETPDHLRERALNVLAQAWEEREKQTCKTCRYGYEWKAGRKWLCMIHHREDGMEKECDVMGNYCGAWEARER